MNRFMQAAFEEALKGLKEGGVPIGAVLVENGLVIGRGRNQRVQQEDQLMHAEIDCLRDARLTGGYHNTILYSTLMPCYLCAGAVVQFGIKKVVVGEASSAPGARDFMESHGIEVVDLDLKECRELMEGYINKNQALWDGFLSELNPDLLIARLWLLYCGKNSTVIDSKKIYLLVLCQSYRYEGMDPLYEKIGLARRLLYVIIAVLLFIIGLILMLTFFIIITLPFALAAWVWAAIFIYLAAAGRPYSHFVAGLPRLYRSGSRSKRDRGP